MTCMHMWDIQHCTVNSDIILTKGRLVGSRGSDAKGKEGDSGEAEYIADIFLKMQSSSP